MSRTPEAAPAASPARDALIDRYFDGVITPGELDTLSAQLREDPAAARAFVRAARMDSALHTHFHRQTAKRAWSEAWSGADPRLPLKIRLHASWNRWRERAEERRWWGPAGAVLAHAALIFILIRWAVPHPSAPRPGTRETIYPADITMGVVMEPREAFDPVVPIPRPDPSARIADYHPDPMSLPADEGPDPFADILLRRLPETALRASPDAGSPGTVLPDGPDEAIIRLAAMRRHMGAMADAAEEAARRGGDWLARSQLPDGGWPGASGNGIRTTALPLLALLQQGEGPRSPRYGMMITAGLRWLMDRQQEDGWFGAPGEDAESHALALTAVSEAYRLSRIPSLRASRDRALAASLAAQDAGGLWPRGPGYDLDLDATAAHMMALDSVRAFPSSEMNAQEAMDRAVRGVLSLRAPHIGAGFASSRSAADGRMPPPSRPATRRAAWALQFARTPIPAEVHRTIQAALFHPADPALSPEYEDEMIVARLAFHEGGRAWTLWKSRRLPKLLAGQTREGAWAGSPGRPARVEETACALLAISSCMTDDPHPLRMITRTRRGPEPSVAAASVRRNVRKDGGAS